MKTQFKKTSATMSEHSFEFSRTDKLAQDLGALLVTTGHLHLADEAHALPFDAKTLAADGERGLTAGDKVMHDRAGVTFGVARGLLPGERRAALYTV